MTVGQFDLRFDVLQMMIHELHRLLGVPPLDGLGDLQVLAVGTGHSTRRFIERDDQGGARNQFVEELAQHVVAGQARQIAVEIAREFDAFLLPAPLEGGLLGFGEFHQTIGILFRSQGHGAFDEDALDGAPGFEDVAGFVSRGFGDRCALVGHQVDEALVRKFLKYPADDGTAHAKGGRECILRQGRAGRNAMVDDRCVDVPVNAFAQLTVALA